MPKLSLVGDTVSGTCVHKQTYFPFPMLSFGVTGAITSGDTTVRGPNGISVAIADPSVKFGHAACQGEGASNQFSIDSPPVPSVVTMGDSAKQPAYVGYTTSHCGGVGSIVGPGAATVS